MDRSGAEAYLRFTLMKNSSPVPVSSRRLVLGVLSALVLMVLAVRGAAFQSDIAHAAAPAIS